MKTPHEKAKQFAEMNNEQKQDIQIKVCSRIDEINKVIANSPLLAFYMEEDIAELTEQIKRMEYVCNMFDRFLKP